MSGARRLSRREFLGVAGGTAVVAVTGPVTTDITSRQNVLQVLTSAVLLPEPFRAPLPIPPLARPVSTAGGMDRYEVVQRAVSAEILPGLRTEVWGFDGMVPGPTFVGRSGRGAVVTVRNELPAPTSTHLHGGVTPPDSDGGPTDLVVPRGWGREPAGAAGHHAGHGGMHVAADAWRMSDQVKQYTYPLDQPAATLWYHDHRMDFSAPQVWRGLAGFFLVRDDAEENLPLPAGERDIPLMLCDRAFEGDGSFRYPSLDPSLRGQPGVEERYMNGVLGDVMLVNGAPWPELEVDAVRYRFRLLNASNARRYRLKLEPGGPLVQIASDGGLLAGPVTLEEVALAPGERAEVVLDFSRWQPGTAIRLVNTLGEGRMREVMRFRVTRRAPDASRVPERLADIEPLTAAHAATMRTFDFRLTHPSVSGHVWTINGHPFSTERDLAAPRLGTVERWRFTSDFHHPVHLHLAHFQVLARDGRPPYLGEQGWKDTVDVHPYETVDVLARFDGFRGRYMFHCHNLEHEDMAMMGIFRVV
ncbi:multicopper oxidase family protein [Saccharopolyspora sp. K220]|uniref:multicopper oxidase family protein n=1 Tax=Saccharopolyspora soli TaxID=2926618 RepID=UPI001F5AED51|nr:multicopper oxidase family protein [Saccharopolyspora soli]MCI2422976.1 multicopper oxidase family protein [Saccharopolyspora soli]